MTAKIKDFILLIYWPVGVRLSAEDCPVFEGNLSSWGLTFQVPYPLPPLEVVLEEISLLDFGNILNKRLPSDLKKAWPKILEEINPNMLNFEAGHFSIEMRLRTMVFE